MSSLAQKQAKIDQEFSRYEALQARHMSVMQQESPTLPDIKQLTEERKEASSSLQSALNNFMENAGSLGQKQSLALLSAYEERMHGIMALDERIAAEIERYRDWIKNQLSQMTQGKQAMQGYQSAANPSSSPRVVSFSR